LEGYQVNNKIESLSIVQLKKMLKIYNLTN